MPFRPTNYHPQRPCRRCRVEAVESMPLEKCETEGVVQQLGRCSAKARVHGAMPAATEAPPECLIVQRA